MGRGKLSALRHVFGPGERIPWAAVRGDPHRSVSTSSRDALSLRPPGGVT
ncbi:Uncharacterised protein [Amycolatopsis camponoti]|uniref:Uncharacterized protein n=1 Tax=Amycolatopsis camponoti TaxID=2606593 RepID=A0A6I8M1J5_9PSEU|nr:Uncharacterised protein [Amycolatopsis camponoti]